MKVGNEFEISAANLTMTQVNPSTTSIPGAGFVVTWWSGGDGGSSSVIHGQVFDETGTKVGNEFQMNAASLTQSSSVTPLFEGGFVVTWISPPQGGNSYIYGQLFDGTGTKVGSEFQVNIDIGYQISSSYQPCAASISGGNFLVTWGSFGQPSQAAGVYGQLFNGTGTKLGNEFQVNTFLGQYVDQYQPTAAPLSNGGFIVAWDSTGQYDSSYGIYGQLFNAAGGKVGGEFQINTFKGSQNSPKAIPLSDGGVVVIWLSYQQDGNYYGIYGQRFDGMGKKVGSEFRLSTDTTANQIDASAAPLSGGGFVVMWGVAPSSGNFSISGRLFPDNFIATPQPTTFPTPPLMSNALITGSLGASNNSLSKASALDSAHSTSATSSQAGPSHSSESLPIIIGLAGAGAALACSLLGGGLYFCQKKAEL